MESETLLIAAGAAPEPDRYDEVRSRGHPRIAGRPETTVREEQPRKGIAVIPTAFCTVGLPSRVLGAGIFGPNHSALFHIKRGSTL